MLFDLLVFVSSFQLPVTFFCAHPARCAFIRFFCRTAVGLRCAVAHIPALALVLWGYVVLLSFAMRVVLPIYGSVIVVVHKIVFLYPNKKRPMNIESK